MRGDVLIVGAGSAGSVLAARLSADDRCRVLVVDAGPGPTDPRVGSQLTDGLQLPIGASSAVVRRYPTVLTDRPRRVAEIMRGAVVGGSGAVNGGYFCRALPSDIDGWAVPGWSWDDVLPHFRAVETDLDFPGGVHGSDGPITVRRVDEFDGCTASFVEAAGAAGFAWIDDLNGSTAAAEVGAGVGAVPLNIERGTRVGPGGAFLVPHLHRPNLTLLTDTRIDRLRVDGTGVTGAEGLGPDGPVALDAPRVVLAAGAIATAQLLMLSGIGPADVLARAGIAARLDLPVGAASVDHPEWVLPVGWTPTRGVPPLEAVLTTDAGVEIRPYTQGFGAMTSALHDDPTDHPHLGVTLMRPRSRGRVAVRSADPAAPPLVEHRYDSAPEDVAALRDGAAIARALASLPDESEASWATSQHLCGTARMGRDGDPEAVVDPRCRVFGLEGLWVIDGSILPAIPSRGPHATIVMAAHRAAEFVS